MFTVKQAAAKLGISPSLVYALVGANKIRHERFGLGRGTIRIPEEALDEYRRRCTAGAGGLARQPARVTPEPTSGPFTMLDAERLAAAWEKR